MNKYPKLSIVVPTYNRRDYLKECLDSIINQNYPNIEIIITDDNSTDDTEEVSKNYITKYPFIKYIKNKKYLQGPNGNKNNGLDYCTGELMAIFDDDDYFIDNNALKYLVKQLIEKNADAVMGSYIRGDDWTSTVSGLNKPQYIDYGDYICGKIKGDSFLIVKNNFWKNIRYNDELYGGEGTTNFKVLYKAKIFHTLKNIAYYRVHKDNVCLKGLSKPSRVLRNYEFLFSEIDNFMRKKCRCQLAYYYKEASYFSKLSSQYKKGFKYLIESIKLCPKYKSSYIMFIVMFFPKQLIPYLSKVSVFIKSILK
jgi:GalNAc5-diNAcBac-PP-undecaprenol beta-1,3-glucosyltransferase